MTTEMKPAVFENAAFGSVRVVMREGEPWFVASDVAKALGFVNPSDAVNRHCKKSVKTPFNVIHEDGNNPVQVNIIPESDLYRLIMRSNLPTAEAFQDWVTEEVLPSIRKTGQYSVAVPKTLPEALRAYADEVERRVCVEKELAIEQEAHANTKEHLALSEEQRDRAIKEKAWIGSRREATSMATASAATRRANNWKASAGVLADTVETQRDTIDDLNDKLGQGETRKATKAIPWLLEIFAPSKGMYSVVGRKLTQIGRKMGIPPLEMESAEFGTLKLHHVKVIQTLYYMLLADPNMLRAYRKA